MTTHTNLPRYIGVPRNTVWEMKRISCLVRSCHYIHYIMYIPFIHQAAFCEWKREMLSISCLHSFKHNLKLSYENLSFTHLNIIQNLFSIHTVRSCLCTLGVIVCSVGSIFASGFALWFQINCEIHSSGLLYTSDPHGLSHGCNSHGVSFIFIKHLFDRIGVYPFGNFGSLLREIHLAKHILFI